MSISRLKRHFLRLWYWNRSTKIVLWRTETIGVDDGYFTCKHMQHDVKMLYLKGEITTEQMKDQFKWIEYRFFGPRYRKA